jgi:Mitochondrial carrier protein
MLLFVLLMYLDACSLLLMYLLSDHLLTCLLLFTIHSFAGQIAWAMSIAPDTIKSRIQTSTLPLSIISTAQEITRVQGLRGLFTGIEVALFRAFPANAALFVGYELSRDLMGP